jgi:hypothetical protein
MRTPNAYSLFDKRPFTSTFLLLIFIGIRAFGQVTATEDFEGESGNTFSESGIQFTHQFTLANIPGFGYNGTRNFLEIGMSGSTTTLSANIKIETANLSFKINSFVGYVSSGATGITPYNGSITVTGTPVGGSAPVSATISIASASGALPGGQSRDGNGNVSGLSFAGTPLDGLFFTTLTFTIHDENPSNGGIGVRYLALDHINFTTQTPVTTQYSISDESILEGSSGSKTMAFTISRSSNEVFGSVDVQSNNGTATAGSDYVALPLTTINFPAGGALSQTVNVTINGDISPESDESFVLILSSPVGGTFSKGVGTGTILDDDNITETFEDETITNNKTTFSERGFQFTSNGSLFVSRGNDIGAGNCNCPSNALDTKVGNGGTTAYVGSFYLTNPGVSFNLRSIDVFTSNNDGASGTNSSVTVKFTGTKADGSGIVEHVAPIGAISGHQFKTVDFAGTPLAGIQLHSVAVTLGEGINYISLDNIRFGTTTYSATTLLSVNDITVLEGSQGEVKSAAFTVSRNNNSSTFSVNVTSSNLTATAGSDYTAVATVLHFSNGGALSQTVTVPILGDGTIEGNETFTLTLSGATNGVLYHKPTGLGTILDDDKITEHFEDEIHNATSFSENSVSFTASGGLKVVYSGTQGSNFSNYYLTSGTPQAGGVIGKVTLNDPQMGFKVLQLDAWVGNGTPPNFTSGPVTFTGTRFGGGTIVTTLTITSTSNSGSGFQKNITFAGTPLENELLTALEFSLGGGITTLDIDNFTYSVATATPTIEVLTATNQVIPNGNEATTLTGTDFGTLCIADTQQKTFTITNTGSANLTFSTNPRAILGGPNASLFSITKQPDSPVLPGASTTFSVSYTPNTPGDHNATITLSSNALLDNPYVLNLKGKAAAAIQITSQPSNQILSGNGTTANGNAIFTLSATNTAFQWQRKIGADLYENLTNGATYNGVSTNSLTITNPSLSLTGSIYRCLLTGCNTQPSNEASLNIISPSLSLPSGTLAPIDITAGTDEGWTYYVANGDVGFAIQWNGDEAKNSAVVSTINGTPPSAATGTTRALFGMGRYWNVNAPGLGSAVNIRFFYSPSDRTDIIDDAAQFASTNGVSNDGLKWFKTTGESYTPSNLTATGITGNPISLTGSDYMVNGVQVTQFNNITNFSGGTAVASAGFNGDALPVDLLWFTLHKTDDRGVEARWATSSEMDADLFLLERSADARYFETIGTVRAAGNTNEPKHYRFRDPNPLSGINYYRLTEVAGDGSVSRFPIQSISLEGDLHLEIYPNPVTAGSFTLTTGRTTESVSLRSLTGKKLSVSLTPLSEKQSRVTLPEQLPAGIYLITVKEESGAETTRRILIH